MHCVCVHAYLVGSDVVCNVYYVKGYGYTCRFNETFTFKHMNTNAPILSMSNIGRTFNKIADLQAHNFIRIVSHFKYNKVYRA